MGTSSLPSLLQGLAISQVEAITFSTKLIKDVFTPHVDAMYDVSLKELHEQHDVPLLLLSNWLM